MSNDRIAIPISSRRPNPRSLFYTVDGQKRYFSSIEAQIFFGDQYIDEIVQISFSLQENKMPLYGYNSYLFDEIAMGNRFVTGTFSVNFTEPRYLMKVLNTLQIASQNGLITTQENKPYFDRLFNIVIAYGDQDKNITIEDVALTGVSQTLDISGEPILENYTFIARDII